MERKVVFSLVFLFSLPLPSLGGLSADLYFPAKASGVAVDPNSDALYVVDQAHNRVLRFDHRFNLTSSSSPSAIFGNATVGNFTTRTTLRVPYGVCVDNSGTLWISDTGNNRVVWFVNAASIIGSAPPANGVIGHSNFVTSVAGSGQSGLNAPQGLQVLGNSLWVADTGNNRVLRFDNIHTPLVGMNASAVIGQAGFFGTSPQSGADGTFLPGDVLPTNEGLLVADTVNHRVLLFANASLSVSNLNATAVYGQTSFKVSNNTGNPSNSTSSPNGLAVGSDGSLFITDSANNRILLFPPIPPTDTFYTPPLDVIGQSTFSDSLAGSSLSALSDPRLLAYDAKYNSLWAADLGNNRVLRYPNIVLASTVNGSGVQVSFPSRSPDVVLSPYDSFSLTLGNIEEVMPNGTVVVSLPFPDSGYATSSSSDAQQNQKWQFQNSFPEAQWEMAYDFFAVPSTIKSAGISFHVNPGTLKLSLTIFGWNFSGPSNVIRIHITLAIAPPVTTLLSAVNNNITTLNFLSSNILNTTINMLHFAEIDNSTIEEIGFSLNDTSTPGSNASTYDLQLDLPHFKTGFHYDPDFSVVLGSNGGGDGFSGNGNGTNLLPLLALISLVIPAFIFAVGLAAGIYFYVQKRRKIAQVTSRVRNLSSEPL